MDLMITHLINDTYQVHYSRNRSEVYFQGTLEACTAYRYNLIDRVLG